MKLVFWRNPKSSKIYRMFSDLMNYTLNCILNRKIKTSIFISIKNKKVIPNTEHKIQLFWNDVAIISFINRISLDEMDEQQILVTSMNNFKTPRSLPRQEKQSECDCLYSKEGSLLKWPDCLNSEAGLPSATGRIPISTPTHAVFFQKIYY